MAQACCRIQYRSELLSPSSPVRLYVRLILLLATTMCLPGCWHHRVEMVAPEAAEQIPVSFVKDGQTTKSDITEHLGTLAASFEQGRILVFALDKKYRVTASEEKVKFHLVLVFDEEGGQVLQKHSLVRIK